MIMTRCKTRKKMEETDRLTALPTEILFRIMSFLTMQEVVRTCILSKQWKNLWKCLPNLRLHYHDFTRPSGFFEFISKIMSCRDENHSIESLFFNQRRNFNREIMTNFMSFAVSHNIKQLEIFPPFNMGLPSCVFSCQSLTSLSISISSYAYDRAPKIPKSLKLPSLLSLHLKQVPISTNENDPAEPFSNCKKLNTLHIEHCKVVHPDGPLSAELEILNITNATLANLIMDFTKRYKTVISTPNLSTFTLNGAPFQTLHGQQGVNVKILSSSLI